MYRIGVDIGGTSVKLGVVDETPAVIRLERIPTGRIAEADDIIDNIISHCKKMMEQYPIGFTGIGSAGRVDAGSGTIIRAGNLPFKNEPIAARLEEELHIPVRADNDANCSLLGEHAAGVCRECEDAAMLTIGTGIGGAIMIGGKIYRGRFGTAGEFGHFVIDLDGKRCPCGMRGCFEQYASVSALIEMTEACVKETPESILFEKAREGISGATAFDAAREGCAVARKLLEEYGRRLALGINGIVNILQPAVLVLSGGITRQGESLLALITPHLLPEAVIRLSALGDNAGIIGAAFLNDERENLNKDHLTDKE